MSKIIDETLTLDSGLEINRVNDNITLELHTPLHLIIMYNTSGQTGIADNSLCISPKDSLYITYSDHREYLAKPHKHDFYELLIVLKGKIYQEIEGHNLSLIHI